MYKGKLIRVKIKGDYVPCEMSCEVQVNQELLQVTNNTNGRAKSFKKGYYEWSVVLDTRFTVSDNRGASQALLSYILDGDDEVEINILSNDENGAPFILRGNAIPANWGLTAGVSGFATSSTTLQGSGELVQDYELYWRIINAMPANADYDTIINMQ